jgi:hypothetical protein
MKIPLTFMMKKYGSEELREILMYLFSRSDIKEITYKQFVSKIVLWVNYLNCEKTLSNLITKPEESMEVLKGVDTIKQTNTNYHLYLSAVVCFIKKILMGGKFILGIKTETLVSIEDTHTSWRELLKENWVPIQEHYDSNEPTDKQKDMVVPFDDLIEALGQLRIGSPEQLLLAFYTKVAPIRGEYFEMKLIFEDDKIPEEGNYIVMKNGKLVVHDFKANRTCPPIETTISDEVMGWVRESLVNKSRKYLFVTPTENKPYGRTQFSNWAGRTLSKIFNKPMNLTVLRHIYITHMIAIKTPVSELKQLAKNMGHSRTTQRMYDWNQ